MHARNSDGGDGGVVMATRADDRPKVTAGKKREAECRAYKFWAESVPSRHVPVRVQNRLGWRMFVLDGVPCEYLRSMDEYSPARRG